MEDALEEYNLSSTGKQQLDVVFFNSVVEKVVQINRSMKNVGGNTILVAHEGSGSFELVKVAIAMSGWIDCHLYEKDSELEEDWRMQLKDVMNKVISDLRTKHILHVEERDLSSKELLQALDAIAAHGEIFQFFSKEEIDSMISGLR